MDKIKLKQYGGSFNASETDIRFQGVSAYSKPKKAKWLEFSNSEKEDIFFWMNESIIYNVDKGKNQYGWLLESKDYLTNIIAEILLNLEKYKQAYKYIFTYQLQLVALGDPFKFVLPPAVTWIQPKNRKIWNKTKMVSMLVSNSNVLTGHNYRLEYLEKNKHLLDAYGRGIKDILLTDEAMIDYMFHVSMENDIYDAYFTERLTSPMAVGAVPIYRGSKNVVEQYFDPKGVLWEDEIRLEDLNKDLYYTLMPHIKNNFEIAAFDFPTPEDYIVENYFSV
jgi:hypothetical protein